VQSSFKEIVEEIVSSHHSLLRRELPRITKLVDELLESSQTEPIVEARQIFEKVRNKIEKHLKDEETVLFPTGITIESGGPGPHCNIDLIERIEEMEKEHDGCGKALTTIHQMIACSAPQSELRDELLRTIQLVQDDLTIHVEKENQNVHPRFLKLLENCTH
jgi:iron-sulfur cluster repair protein YtfE (RIC family)